MTDALWNPALKPPLWVVAESGGVDLTSLVALGLFIWLWRRSMRWEAMAVLAIPLASGGELALKHAIAHAAPPLWLSHGDAPSLIENLLEAAGRPLEQSSYPSGHMARAMVTYGLLALVLPRAVSAVGKSTWLWVGATVVAVLMAADRILLEVHWLSDVIGGAIWGGILLLAADLWLGWEPPWRRLVGRSEHERQG